jgi:3'(2'), 5'-bisphosphate nucleotidase
LLPLFLILALKLNKVISVCLTFVTIVIETIDPVEIKRIGGAGNKCCNVATGNVDAYIHPSVGLKYWDLCASETLIKAVGGFATDFK